MTKHSSSSSSSASLTLDETLQQAEAMLAVTVWLQLEEIHYVTFQRVLESFIRHRVGEEHFYSVTGYGHDDMGREVTDAVFADALQAEAALVRTQFASGTHAIAVALNGCLRHGDTLLSVTGRPYDTLEEVIGLRGKNPQSLKSKGIRYEEISVFKDGVFDTQSDAKASSSQPFLWRDEALVKKAKLVYIQRSRGYSLRPSLSIDEISLIIQRVKRINPQVIVFVDNCYGEFTEVSEPTAVGADLMAGSLIKNPGGGIVPAGGYVAGRKDLVESCACVLTCPGVGSEGGYTYDLTRVVLQGLFMAPGIVKEALKGMTLAAHVFEDLGYSVLPSWQSVRSDIIQVIHLETPENLVHFCQILQKYSPINSGVLPIPAQLPGYEDEVVMAGGTFIEGSTLELSADGPLRPPYTVFLQGGLTYAHTRYALSKILEKLLSTPGQGGLGQNKLEKQALQENTGVIPEAKSESSFFSPNFDSALDKIQALEPDDRNNLGQIDLLADPEMEAPSLFDGVKSTQELSETEGFLKKPLPHLQSFN
ncbi:MAG: methionine gamma-lyase family protein [Cyanobacteria bacterium]|nr:methionine gamma-lyase family protein [Cyanobacteriota bacterium]